jgi:ribosomal-protein-alanine N-acetyltransferase
VTIRDSGSGSPPQGTPAKPPTISASWHSGLPTLVGERVTLRELQSSDASTLYAELNVPEVRRYSWPPPPNVIAFERFIEWTYSERQAGKYICYGIVPRDRQDAWGVFELRSLQPNFVRGELGFIVAPPYWGSGVFYEAARMLLDFAFGDVKVHRLEIRVPVDNERSNAALKRLGARREGTLKDAFWAEDHFVDQYLWAILATEWGRREGSDAEDTPRTGTLG